MTDAAKPADEELYTVESNRDGSAVIRFKHPVTVTDVNGKTDTHSRAFIPALTGRHMRKAAWSLHDGATVGDLIAFAAEVVEPAGIVDALPAWTSRQVANVVFLCLGKSQPGGDTTSSA